MEDRIRKYAKTIHDRAINLEKDIQEIHESWLGVENKDPISHLLDDKKNMSNIYYEIANDLFELLEGEE